MTPWIEPQAYPESAALAAHLGLHPLAASILVRRGLTDPAAARAFLDPDYYRPSPPDALPGIAKALPLVQRALAAHASIMVWGDFDVDGQTATAVLVQALGDLGGRVRWHIPVRAQEGHGISVARLCGYLDGEDPPSLLITCDTGATAFEALEAARARQVTVIVTDHHEPMRSADGQPILPAVDAFISPRLLRDEAIDSAEAAWRAHPLAALPGVGVAFKLIEALYDAAGKPEAADDYLDLVALGIVGDVAWLTGDTRYLLQRGLRRLRLTPRSGLQAIFERAELDPASLNEEHIGFLIAPRLNALGRLGDANPAVELLITADWGRARLLAVQLEGLNARRQLLTGQIMRSALRQIEVDPAVLAHELLLLWHPQWEPGVIGIVAGRLAEHFRKPAALVCAPPGGPARGSARSTAGIDITAALADQAHQLTSYGGHALAAGFTMDAAALPRLRLGLSQAIARQRAGKPPLNSGLQIDGVSDWGEIDLALAFELERLAPFGPANPAPVLVTPNLRIVGRSSLGREREHLALRLEDEAGIIRRVIWWGGAAFAGSDQEDGVSFPDGPIDLAYTVRPSTRLSGDEVQIEWLDYRLSQAATEPLERHIKVVDNRRSEQPLTALQQWLSAAMNEPEPGADPHTLETVQIWAEAGDRLRLAERLGSPSTSRAARVVGRLEISACRRLVIWSIPPSRAVLADALQRARPLEVVLFAVDPGMDDTRRFLERLAGLARYVLAGAAEPVALARLAAETAQTIAAVQHGLTWMAAGGMIQAQFEAETVLLAPGDQGKAAAAHIDRLQQLLEESRAFRRYYQNTLVLDLEKYLAA